MGLWGGLLGVVVVVVLGRRIENVVVVHDRCLSMNRRGGRTWVEWNERGGRSQSQCRWEMDSMGRYDELRLILCEKRMYIVKIRV